jgi:hypothetical protein
MLLILPGRWFLLAASDTSSGSATAAPLVKAPKCAGAPLAAWRVAGLDGALLLGCLLLQGRWPAASQHLSSCWTKRAFEGK